MQKAEWDLPDPPGVGPVRRSSPWKWPLIILAGIIMAAGSFYVPLPMYYAYLPGPVRDVEDLVDIDGASTYSSEGELLLTTVSVDTDVSLADFISAMFSDDREIVLKDEVTQGGSIEQLRRQQRAEMQQSKENARGVVFQALGFPGDGAEVVELVPEMPAAKVLDPGDVLVAIDGERVDTACDVTLIMNSKVPGTKVALTVERNDERRTFEVKAAENPDRPGEAFLG